LTPRALLNRLERGVVYAPEKAQTALQNFFRESNLVALREMALRQAAHEVDMRDVDPQSLRADGSSKSAADHTERILVHVTADPASAMVIRRAWRVAEFIQAECFAVHVGKRDSAATPQEKKNVDKHLRFARDLHIETRLLDGEDEAKTLVEF